MSTKSTIPVFQTEYLHAQPGKISVLSHQDGIFEVRGEFGIGKGAIELVEGEWPETCTIRLHLKGLEGFDLTVGEKRYEKFDLEVSTILDVDDAWFEVKIPRSLLPEGTKRFEFLWVDFYR